MMEMIKRYQALFLIILATAIVYSAGLSNGFVFWDDNFQVATNPAVLNFDWGRMWSGFTMGMYQPLTTLSLAVVYKLCGLNPTAFHVWSLILHIINIALVYVLVNAVFKGKGVLVAALFALTPLNVEAVAWVSATSTLLATTFSLGSLIGYWRFKKTKQRRFYILTFGLFVLACLSKSVAVSLPLLYLIIDYYADGRLTKKCLWQKALFLLVAFAVSVLAVYGRELAGHFNIAAFQYDRWEYLLFMSHAVMFYLTKAIFPFVLSTFYYPFPDKINGCLPAVYWSSLFGIFGFATLLICSAWRKYLAIILALVFSSLVLMLNFPYLSGSTDVTMNIVADRYFYQAGIFIYLGLVLLVGHYSKRLLLIVVCCLLPVFICYDWRQIKVWRNYEAVLTDSIEHYGYQSSMATMFSNRGKVRQDRGDDVGALADFETAIRLRPDLSTAYNNRSVIRYLRLHDPSGALADNLRAWKLSPDNPSIMYNLANLYLLTGQPESALPLLNKAIDISANRSPEEMTDQAAYRALRAKIIK